MRINKLLFVFKFYMHNLEEDLEGNPRVWFILFFSGCLVYVCCTKVIYRKVKKIFDIFILFYFILLYKYILC